MGPSTLGPARAPEAPGFQSRLRHLRRLGLLSVAVRGLEVAQEPRQQPLCHLQADRDGPVVLVDHRRHAVRTARLLCPVRYRHWLGPNARWTIGDDLNPWAGRLFQTIQAIDPQTPKEQIAYTNWLDQRAAREVGRQARSHGADGVIPAALWVILLTMSGVIFVFMLFLAVISKTLGHANISTTADLTPT